MRNSLPAGIASQPEVQSAASIDNDVDDYDDHDHNYDHDHENINNSSNNRLKIHQTATNSYF